MKQNSEFSFPSNNLQQYEVDKNPAHVFGGKSQSSDLNDILAICTYEDF